MASKLAYTLLFVFFLVLAILSVASFVFFLRKLTNEWAHPGSFQLSKHWWRVALPTAVALFFAGFGDMGKGIFVHWVYLLIFGILLPLAVTFFLLRESLEKKWERILMTVALLFLINASIFSTGWYWHHTRAHAGEQGAPHRDVRNAFHLPLWIITIIVTFSAVFLWRHNNRKENEEFLPHYVQG